MAIDFTLVELSSFYELYKITYLTHSWHYTSADHSITYNGNTYLPAAIKHGSLVKQSELDNFQLDISFPAEGFFLRYVSEAPVYEATITIHLYQDPANVVLAFSGIVTKVTIGQNNECTVMCDEQNLLATKLPNKLIQSACNHKLFDAGCGLVKADWKEALVIKEVSYPLVKSDDLLLFDANYFVQGWLEFEGDLRWILAVIGDAMYLQIPFRDLEAGDTVFAYPGCDKAPQTCKERFDNLDKYLGCPYVPRKNPVFYGL